VLVSLVLPGAAAGEVDPVPAPAATSPLPSPVMRGDWPDPDITEIDGVYYAVATSGGWAPTFRILRSTDLRAWEIAGSVFRRAPGWAKDSFWAPEMMELPSGGYAVVYSAYPRKRPGRTWYCLGIATAPSPLGPWRDLGRPLRCTPRGTIDATPVRDGDDFYLVYKEDGNAFDRPTPILRQRFAENGRKLIGKPRALLTNRPRSWERRVVEAPALVKRDGWWYMLYSGNLCCSPSCAYAVGVARARVLAGPWTRHPGNPILRSGNSWRCPGHVSIVGDRVAFHAYRAGGFLAGRQLHIADLTFGADGWPAIAGGRPLPPSDGAVPTAFDDHFAGAALGPEWEWPVTRAPRAQVAHGLTLAAPRRAGKRLDAGVLARRIGSQRFTATAIVELPALTGAEAAGLAVIRGGPFQVGGQAIGIAVGQGKVFSWRRGGGRYTVVDARADLPGPFVHLRVTAEGRRMRFAYSSDGATWKGAGSFGRSPVEETARIALTAGGAPGTSASFTRASLVER
jgi:xylan 1,4-beta-xylosidase